MKLVIDSEAVQQCTMQVGGIDIPLTREQVVGVLFGKEYEIVRVGEHGRTKPSSAAKRSYAKRAVAVSAEPGAREPNGMLRDDVVAILSARGESSLSEIREALEKKNPQRLVGKPSAYLPGALTRLVNAGDLKRSGSKGMFRYVATRAAVPSLVKVAPVVDEEVKLARAKKAKARYKKGLCARCDKQHLPEKKLCRAHYATILETQKLGGKARKALAKNRKKASGQLEMLNGAGAPQARAAFAAEAVN